MAWGMGHRAQGKKSLDGADLASPSSQKMARICNPCLFCSVAIRTIRGQTNKLLMQILENGKNIITYYLIHKSNLLFSARCQFNT
jgi:hypothetical protein